MSTGVAGEGDSPSAPAAAGSRSHRAARVVGTLLLAAAAGAAAQTAHWPLPWMIGPLLVTALGSAAGLPLAASLRLRNADELEPTVVELHRDGSRYESAHAPIAPAWFPYNRCEVWACVHCGRGFLQYTEFGGYYVDHRLREMDPALVVTGTP